MEKKTKANRQRAKGRELLAGIKLDPPQFNPIDYQLSMIRCLNYYNTVVEDKQKRSYAYQYWKQNSHNTKLLDSLGDHCFHTVGAVAHMVMLDMPVSDHDRMRLDNAYTQLLEQVKIESKTTKSSAQKTPVAKVDQSDEILRSHLGEIEGWIDLFSLEGTETLCKEYLLTHELKPAMVRDIGAFLKGKIKEFTLACDDKETCDAYGGKRKCTAMVRYLESALADCDGLVHNAVKVRAPRVKKAQPPAKLVAKMKYKKELAELRMKSVFPEKIINSSYVFMFDSVKRRLVKYEAMDGYTLTVKGTTIMNWDHTKSGSKIIRKPNEQLACVNDMTKRPLNNLFNDIRGALGKLTGRTNDDMIILKVF